MERMPVIPAKAGIQKEGSCMTSNELDKTYASLFKI
jgi:hypothetical protein